MGINDNFFITPFFPLGTINDIKIELSIDKYLKKIDET
ncbi:MAG: hypothetical protein CM15mP63_4840 [Gammaproteobacteria bacterium]|nr:MAG: hypothetical protein CM15mP63_4840 [Gammaproteobacteria bacterium]